MDFDEHNQPRHGHMEGGVAMDSTSESGGRLRQMQERRPRRSWNSTRKASCATRIWSGASQWTAKSKVSLQGKRSCWNRHGVRLSPTSIFRDSSHGQTELTAVHGTSGVVVTGESQRGKGAVSPSRLSADEVTGNFGLGSALTAMNGVGHASIEEITETGTRQTTSGDRVEAHFAAPAPSVQHGTEGEAQIQSATVEGHVVLTQQPPAKPGAPPPATLRATAGRADYAGEGEWLHLTVESAR